VRGLVENGLLGPERRGSLAQFRSRIVVAIPVQQPASTPRRPVSRPLQLIQGSLSARRMDRQAPWLASLHRIGDGTLAGLGLAVLGLSVLTLHWQGQWTNRFQELEAAQRLEHRLQESAAVLEQHHLAISGRPRHLEATSSEKLVYVAPPQPRQNAGFGSLLGQVNTRRILAGY
jgi:hypothetical protein